MSDAVEVQFDGLVGPTHHFGGLGMGNIASMEHGGEVSHPRAAALQGLAKMKLIADLGVPQAVLPPQVRPDLAALRVLGFEGDDEAVLTRAWKEAPHLLSACSSASAMWTANAATVSPAADSRDGRVHLTPANLVSQLHRSLEAAQTTGVLRAIFADEQHFAVHDPLPATLDLADEGAANHMRLCAEHSQPGLELFVAGRVAQQMPEARRFQPRQTVEAGEAIMRRHRLLPDQCVRLMQSPHVIDQGVFHNDVIAMSNGPVLIVHERAYVDGERRMDAISRAFERATGRSLDLVLIRASELSVSEAVRTYLFNSQLLTLPSGKMVLVYPVECDSSVASRLCVQRVVEASEAIERAVAVDVRQSMHNGGGPACLRLRVVLTQAQRAALPRGIWLTDERLAALAAFIERRYPESLRLADLADVKLVRELHDTAASLRAMLLGDRMHATGSVG